VEYSFSFTHTNTNSNTNTEYVNMQIVNSIWRDWTRRIMLHMDSFSLDLGSIIPHASVQLEHDPYA